MSLTLILLPNDEGITKAVTLLAGEHLVALPTETVYGLAGDATSAAAVAAIFAAKGRPRFNPLICHYADARSAAAHVVFSEAASVLADAFWPGPLTLVLPRRADCPVHPRAAAGLATLAVRVPAHPVAAALLHRFGRPLAAPSANRSGGVSPTTAAHVLADLDGRITAVLDAGACTVGLESTVVDCTTARPRLLRPGGITAEALAARVGPLDGGHTPGAALHSPGLLDSHYAPTLPLRLNAAAAGTDEALLAFGEAPAGALVFNLSKGRDLVEAAARLFAGLRWLDGEGGRLGLRGIAAMAVPEEGLGAAINDRLRRAAAKKKEGLLF